MAGETLSIPSHILEYAPTQHSMGDVANLSVYYLKGVGPKPHYWDGASSEYGEGDETICSPDMSIQT